MKSLTIHSAGIVLALNAFIGCVSIHEMNTRRMTVLAQRENSIVASNSGSPTYLFKASAYETEGDLRMALYYLKIAASISPEEKQISERIADLKQRIDDKAEFHFKAGLDLYRRQQLQKARQAFLSTLLYNPQHPQALVYLKSRFSPFRFESYKAKKGDKKTDIANKIFLDPDKAFLISYFFEETGNQEILKEGMQLELPYLESAPVKQKAKTTQQPKDTPSTDQIEKTSPLAFNIQLELAKADGFLKNKQYDNVMVIADKIFDQDNFSKEAEGLINKVYFQKGNDLFKAKHYLEARMYFSFIDPEYISTDEIQATIKAILDKQAETNYLKGVNFFIIEDLENAIAAWETVLKLNPEHAKAKTDIQNAKHLLEKLQDLD